MTKMKLSEPRTVSRELVLNTPRWGSRGRNGWFTATSVAIYGDSGIPDGPNAVAPEIRLSAASRRPGKENPLRLSLSPEDAVLLAEELLLAVREVMDQPEGLITGDIEHRLQAIREVLAGHWSHENALAKVRLILNAPLQVPAPPQEAASA